MKNIKDLIPKGTWIAVKRYCYDTYRTEDGKALFEFRFLDLGRHFEIDIGLSPGYRNRSRDPHNTHRRNSSRGGNRICVGDDSAIKTLSEAKEIAIAWAEQTWRYILTGKPFNNI